MSNKKQYKVMHTSAAFLFYLKSKNIEHSITDDGKMTVLKLYSDTDLLQIGIEYSREITLVAAAEAARMVEISDDDTPNFWRPGPISVPTSHGTDLEYVVSKSSILNSII